MPVWLSNFVALLQVSGWSDLAGFVASIIAILGVPVAALKAWQAKSAAELARSAAEQTRTRVASTDVLAALATALGRLDSIAGLSPAAVAALRQARHELIEIAEERRILDDEQRRRVQATVTMLSEVERGIRQGNEDTKGALKLQFMDMLTSRTDDLRQLRAQLRQRLAGLGS